MNCPKCKLVVSDGDDVCTNCGADIETLRIRAEAKKTSEVSKKAKDSEPKISMEQRRKLQRAYLVCSRCGVASWEQYAIRIDSQIPGLMNLATTDASIFDMDPGGVCVVSRGYLPDVWTKVTSTYATDPSSNNVYCMSCGKTQPQNERLLQRNEVRGNPKKYDGTPRESGSYEERIANWESTNRKFGLGCALPAVIMGIWINWPYLPFIVVVPWFLYQNFVNKPKD